MAYALRSRSLNRLLVAGMMLALTGSLPVTAEDPPQQASPTPTPTAVPGSLAAASAGLRLQPTEETGSGALVITNQNLKATGAGAAVSQGAATVPPGPGPNGPQGPVAAVPAAANDLAARLLEQQARVDDIATRLQSMDEQLAAPPTDPHYPKVDTAPQFRAPGVIDPARGERDALAAQLEAERAKLDALRAQAGSAGVTLTKAPNEAPTPTP
jgi:hypothetical protein